MPEVIDAVTDPHQGHNPGSEAKNWLAALLYATSVPLAYASLWFSTTIFILIPILYFLPSHDPTAESE